MIPHPSKNIMLYNHLFLFVLIFLLQSAIGRAQGDLMVYPKRIVFGNHQRFEKLNITNTGKDTTYYTISTLNIKMEKDGGFHIINSSEAGHQFADSNFRFFPREIVLAPKESQTVKLQLIRSAELTPGEYRSHLYFRHDPNRNGNQKQKAPTNTNNVSIKLTPIYGVTIPIIIRKGTVNATVNLNNFTLDTSTEATPVATFQLNRSGNRSVYGNIEVTHIDVNHKKTVVGKINGVSVYTPNTERIIKLPLYLNTGVDLTTGLLHISFKEGDQQLLEEVYKL